MFPWTFFKSKGTSPLTWPKRLIECDVDEVALSRMFAHVEADWRALGKSEPYWSVLTATDYKTHRIATNKACFYATGKGIVGNFLSAVDRSHSELKGGRCFELGCGVGRVTLALADHFDSVVAADISEPHLALARRAAEEAGKSNIEFVHLGQIDDLHRFGSYDCFFSVLVLQHNPPPIVKHILGNMLNKVGEGGFVYFQLMTYNYDRGFLLSEYLKKMRTKGVMEMHPFPQHEVFRLLRDLRFSVLEVREDGMTAHPRHLSNSFLAVRD